MLNSKGTGMQVIVLRIVSTCASEQQTDAKTRPLHDSLQVEHLLQSQKRLQMPVLRCCIKSIYVWQEMVWNNSLETWHMLESQGKRDVNARPGSRNDCQEDPPTVAAGNTEYLY